MPELRASAENDYAAFLSEALAALHQYVWLQRPASGDYIYISPALVEVLGLDPASPERPADLWAHAIHPADREALLAALNTLQIDGEALVTEHRILTAQGQARWMQAMIRLYTSRTGERILAGVLVDISAQKSAEGSLRRSEQRFENVVANLSKAVILSQPDGTILMANPAATRQFGYSEAELIAGGRSLILDETAGDFQLHHQDWLQGHKATSVLTFRHRDGSRFQAEVSSMPFRLETGETQLVSLIRDISQELAYTRVTRQLYEISETMPGAIYQFRMAPDGAVSLPFFSRSAEHQWGFSAEALTAQPEGFLGLVHPADRDTMMASIQASADTLSPWLMKFRAWDLNQACYRWIRGQSIPSRQPDGSILWNGTLLDIDEAEQNLLALEAERNQLQTILDSMGEGLTVVDSSGRIQLINAGGQRLLGTGPTDAPPEQWSRHFGLFLPGGTELCAAEDLPALRALKGEQVRNCELWLQGPDGQRRHLLFTATPLRDAQGTITGAVSLYRDITALYLAEQQLRQTSERYALASRATSDVIWDDDLLTGELTISPMLCERFGYPESDLNTRHSWWRERLHPEDRARVIAGWEQAIAAREQRWEDQYRFPDAAGDYRYIYDRGYILYSPQGQPVRMIGSMQDVTENKLAELRLRKSETHLLASQQIAHIGSWEVDLNASASLDTAPVHWSEECFRIFGFEPGEVTPSVPLVLARTHPDDVAAVQAAVTHTLMTGELYSIEHRILYPDGQERIIWQQGELKPDAGSGKPERVIGTVQDITTIKAHERRIQEQNESLRKIAWQQSHEVRRPLANLLGLLNLMENGPYPQDKLALLRHEAQALDRIVGSIVRSSEGILKRDAELYPLRSAKQA